MGDSELSELTKDLMIESMIKSLDAIASKTEDEKTREYAAKVAKLNRDTLAKINDLRAAPAETTE